MGAEFASPKYASLAYWLFGVDYFEETAGRVESLKTK